MSRKDTFDEIQAQADLDRRNLEAAAVDNRNATLTDAFTGVEFTPRARNHYEVNIDPPKAPPVDFPRPTVRQRVENLISRDPDSLARYLVNQANEPDTYEMDVPDDPEAPLTASEQTYLDMLASEVAEASPLPDDGLQRPEGALKPAPAASGGAGGSPPAEGAPAPSPAPGGGTVST